MRFGIINRIKPRFLWLLEVCRSSIVACALFPNESVWGGCGTLKYLVVLRVYTARFVTAAHVDEDVFSFCSCSINLQHI